MASPPPAWAAGCSSCTALLFSSFVLTAHGQGEAERASESDLPEISALLQSCGARQQFTPVWTIEALRAAIAGGLRVEDFFVLRRNGAIRACAALWDTSAHRQLVVTGYAPWLARMRMPGVIKISSAPATLPCAKRIPSVHARSLPSRTPQSQLRYSK